MPSDGSRMVAQHILETGVVRSLHVIDHDPRRVVAIVEALDMAWRVRPLGHEHRLDAHAACITGPTEPA